MMQSGLLYEVGAGQREVTEVTYGYLLLPHSAPCWPASPAGPALRATAPAQSYRCTGQEEHTAEEGEQDK